MLTETTVPGSDDWWLMRLATDLGNGMPRLHELRSYRDGTSAVPDGASMQMRTAYQRFVNMSRLNFAAPIVGAVTSRLRPTGFRTAAAGDDDGDRQAMSTWTGSHMGSQSRDLFDDLATYGAGFVVNVRDGGLRKMSPWDTITDASLARPWQADAGLVAGFDPVDQVNVLELYRPGYSRRAILPSRTSVIPSNGSAWYPGRGWEWAEDPQPVVDVDGQHLPDKMLVNRLDAQHGMGQFEAHTDALDRINHTVLQRLTIVAMQAFRQRAVKGNLPKVYPPDHPQAGQQIDYDKIFEAGPAALWMLPADADIWESAVTDIQSILNSVKEDLRNLAASSFTPLYVLSPDAAAGSAEGASLAREMLVFKVEDLIDRASDQLGQTMATSFALQGDSVRADASQLETIWQPADRVSINERANAASQAVTSMSKRMIQEKIYQLSPAELQRERQYEADEAFSVGLTDA